MARSLRAALRARRITLTRLDARIEELAHQVDRVRLTNIRLIAQVERLLRAKIDAERELRTAQEWLDLYIDTAARPARFAAVDLAAGPDETHWRPMAAAAR